MKCSEVYVSAASPSATDTYRVHERATGKPLETSPTFRSIAKAEEWIKKNCTKCV